MVSPAPSLRSNLFSGSPRLYTVFAGMSVETQALVETHDGLALATLGLDAIRKRWRWYSYRITFKRLFDIGLAAAVLVLTLPLWFLVAFAIRLDSPGPVIYVQERVGLNGKRFRFYKFRSMYAGADQRREELVSRNEVDGPVFKIRKDPRITRVGRLLRRTSLDELPQLINVLSGDMSLVGPRPPIPAEVEGYRPLDRLRLTVKPGLTCLWQIRGRSNCTFDQWMEYDREYVSQLSLGLDLSILIRTVWVVLNCRGAY
jgi:lipopolysaccharide/colanic/teichoic acid biosynthesis glycosyltransferase